MGERRGATGVLGSIFRRRAAAPRDLELVVLEGADTGQRFPLAQAEIQLGRGAPASRRANEILLSHPSVSSRQAIVSSEGDRVVVRHLPSATNPTLVNGRSIKRKRIRPGDRIVVGLVVLELRERDVVPDDPPGSEAAAGTAAGPIATRMAPAPPGPTRIAEAPAPDDATHIAEVAADGDGTVVYTPPPEPDDAGAEGDAARTRVFATPAPPADAGATRILSSPETDEEPAPKPGPTIVDPGPGEGSPTRPKA